jgi:hypothetical protein
MNNRDSRINNCLQPVVSHYLLQRRASNKMPRKKTPVDFKEFPVAFMEFPVRF